jgi:hypothetical protein
LGKNLILKKKLNLFKFFIFRKLLIQEILNIFLKKLFLSYNYKNIFGIFYSQNKTYLYFKNFLKKVKKIIFIKYKLFYHKIFKKLIIIFFKNKIKDRKFIFLI